MSGKRGSIEISAAILEAAIDGAKKSHIIYESNLNFKIGKKYLDRLKRRGLIEGPNSRSRSFQTTEKGVEYIKHFESLKELRDGSKIVLKSWRP